MVTFLVALLVFPHFSSHLDSHFSISVAADEDNVKDVLLTSPLMVSWYRKEHPSDTEDEGGVVLSSDDEAEGLGPEAGVAWRGQAAGAGQPGRATPHSSGRRRGHSQEVGSQEGEAAGVIPP